MDLPRPQPGQKSIPIFFNGQIEKCEAVSALIKASINNPEIQITASGLNTEKIFLK